MSNQELNKQERIFCELFMNGCAPYAGNAVKCYIAAFKKDPEDVLNNHNAKLLLNEERIKDYLKELESYSIEEAADVKRYLTANLKHIIEEASTVEIYDRRGNRTSPAAIRSVAVSASKALMDMYPIKEAQVNKLDINGNGEEGGITFNVIVPQSNNKE